MQCHSGCILEQSGNGWLLKWHLCLALPLSSLDLAQYLWMFHGPFIAESLQCLLKKCKLSTLGLYNWQYLMNNPCSFCAYEQLIKSIPSFMHKRRKKLTQSHTARYTPSHMHRVANVYC